MNPKVTIIVLTYNQRATIARTLESILAQKVNFDYEILIGDDGSADGTRELCERYHEMRPGMVRLMPPAQNKGVTDNYFDCLEQAHGEYIADCAGDDWWVEPKKLQRQVDFLDSHPEVGMIHTAWRPVDAVSLWSKPDVVHDYPTICPAGELLMPLLRHEQPQPIHLSTALYRRSMLMKIYEEDKALFRNGCAEDLPISAMLSARHSVAYLPEVTLQYSVGSDSVCNPARAARATEFYRQSLELTVRIAEKNGVKLSDLTPDLRRLHAYALSLAIQSGNSDAVKALANTCRKIHLTPSLKSRLKLLIHWRKWC